MYFEKCSRVTQNIGDHLYYLCMEYECGISAIELHSYDNKVETEFYYINYIFV